MGLAGFAGFLGGRPAVGQVLLATRSSRSKERPKFWINRHRFAAIDTETVCVVNKWPVWIVFRKHNEFDLLILFFLKFSYLNTQTLFSVRKTTRSFW